MRKYVEIGYPVYQEMPVYPGLPKVEILLREDMDKGAPWNGSVLSIYLHAGTHVDAPWHYMGGNAPKMDNTSEIPTEAFIYKNPLQIDINVKGKDYLISVDDLKKVGQELYEADALFLVTGWWGKRRMHFEDYANGFPALSPEAAEWIRKELPLVKAVAIDTLSIENIGKEYGASNGYRTHKALLDPDFPNHSILIYEDINPEPIIGKKLLRAFSSPLRIAGDASICNIICEIEDE